MTTGLGQALTSLPRDFVQSEIVGRVDDLTMMVVRHTLLGHPVHKAVKYDLVDTCKYGLGFFKWCRSNVQMGAVTIDSIKRGSPDCIRWMIQYDLNMEFLFECIATADAMEYMIFVRERYIGLSNIPNLITHAAKGGALKCAKYLYDQCRVMPTCVCDFAALGGNSELLLWAFENGGTSSHIVCENAALSGNLDVLKLLHARSGQLHYGVYRAAIKSGSLEMLQWLHVHGCTVMDHAQLAAAKRGSLEILRYVCENVKETSLAIYEERCCKAAAKHKTIDCLKYLVDRGFCWHESKCCDAAASRGSLECLKWLICSNNARPSQKICIQAVKGKSLECLMWLHKRGFAVDMRLCQYAISTDSFECFKYICKVGKGLNYTSLYKRSDAFRFTRYQTYLRRFLK